MQRLLMAGLSLVVFSSTAFAAPDETESAVEARYGKPVKRIEPQKGLSRSTRVFYRTATLDIIVWFIEGKSNHEEFTKIKDEAFTDAEIQVLLKSNAPEGISWINVHSEIGGESWRRSDLKALASTSPGNKTVNLITVHR